MSNNKQIQRHRGNRLTVDDLFNKQQKPTNKKRIVNPNYKINFGKYRDRYVFSMETKEEIAYLKWIIDNNVQSSNVKLYKSIRLHLNNDR